jgi:hypothetical protein
VIDDEDSRLDRRKSVQGANILPIRPSPMLCALEGPAGRPFAPALPIARVVEPFQNRNPLFVRQNRDPLCLTSQSRSIVPVP